MIKLQFFDGNNNSSFIKDIFKVISKELNNIYWGIGDLELIPKYLGDYPGSGPHKNEEIAWEFGNKVEREKIVFIEEINQLYDVLNNTQTVRRGVFVCFYKNYPYDYNFRPRVEVTDVNNMQHSLSYIEIKILDGDFFIILTKDSKIISKLKTEFAEFFLE